MNKPRVIWQENSNGYRIVRTGREEFEIEALDHDALGVESWRRIDWLDMDPATGAASKLPHWTLLSILEKLSRRRRRRSKR